MQLGEVEVAGGNYAAGRPVSASSSTAFHPVPGGETRIQVAELEVR